MRDSNRRQPIDSLSDDETEIREGPGGEAARLTCLHWPELVRSVGLCLLVGAWPGDGVDNLVMTGISSLKGANHGNDDGPGVVRYILLVDCAVIHLLLAAVAVVAGEGEM